MLPLIIGGVVGCSGKRFALVSLLPNTIQRRELHSFHSFVVAAEIRYFVTKLGTADKTAAEGGHIGDLAAALRYLGHVPLEEREAAFALLQLQSPS